MTFFFLSRHPTHDLASPSEIIPFVFQKLFNNSAKLDNFTEALNDFNRLTI